MDLMVLGGFVAGLVLLVVGGELLVRGASRLAAALGITPLVIGLTVVALGTSAPEAAVSVQSALAGSPDLALGNVVGSNIFNVLFILGLSALVAPLFVDYQLIRLDVPIMIALSILLWLLALDGGISRYEGVMLVAGLFAYVAFLIRESRKASRAVVEEYEHEYAAKPAAAGGGTLVNLLLIAVGLVLLVLGARWLVSSAVAVARGFGVSELVIGLTLVAAGTSLPEVAASVIATLKGERDIAVGNVVGSNIFNIMAVLGVTSIVAPDGIGVSEAALRFDIPVMIAVAVACLPIFFTGRVISRWEGAVFLAYYLAYTLYLILDTQGHDSLSAYSAAMMFFVIPLTALGILGAWWLDVRNGSAGRGG